MSTIVYPFNLKPGSRIRRRVDDIVATVKQTDAFHVWLATDDTQAKPMLDWPSVAIDWEPAPEPPPKPIRPTFEGWTIVFKDDVAVGAYKDSDGLEYMARFDSPAAHYGRKQVRYEDTAPAEPTPKKPYHPLTGDFGPPFTPEEIHALEYGFERGGQE